MSRLDEATALLLDGTLLLDSPRDARKRWSDRVNEWLRVTERTLRCCAEMLPGHPERGVCLRAYGHDGGCSPYDIDNTEAR